MPSTLSSLINLSNSIIGVSLLTMPYCFQQCGILLSCLVLALSAVVNKFACHLLLKAAMLSRRRKFEYLAYHTLGTNGKLLIEIGLIFFLLGGCIALFVVSGDILPALLTGIISQESRVYLLVSLGFFVALPLSLKRNAESLTSFSTVSMMFYVFLAVKMFFDSLPALMNGRWFHKVVWWNTDNLLAVLPIFAMALAGQPQLFEVFDLAGVDAQQLRALDGTVSSALQTCLTVYSVVGFCGYIALYEKAGTLPGNSLLLLDDSLSSWLFKFGFVASLIMSFPLCLFPCRTSLHSLIYRRGTKLHEMTSSMHDFIPENRFKLLTLSLLFATLSAALVIPRIELFLGITGATIGTVVCFVAPAAIFLGATTKEQTLEKVLAQMLALLGLVILGLCSFSALRAASITQAPLAPAPARTSKVPEGVNGETKLQPVLLPVEKPSPEVPKEVPKYIGDPPVKQRPRKKDTKRIEPVEPQDTPVHEVKTLANKTSDRIKYQIGNTPEKGVPLRNQIDNKTKVVDPLAKGAPPDVNKASVGGDKTGVKKDKEEIVLLETIAKEQQEQKKLIEDIRKELKHEIALHKEIQANQSKESNVVNTFEEKIKEIDKHIKEVDKMGNRTIKDIIEGRGVVKEESVAKGKKPLEFKGPLKILNKRPKVEEGSVVLNGAPGVGQSVQQRPESINLPVNPESRAERDALQKNQESRAQTGLPLVINNVEDTGGKKGIASLANAARHEQGAPLMANLPQLLGPNGSLVGSPNQHPSGVVQQPPKQQEGPLEKVSKSVEKAALLSEVKKDDKPALMSDIDRSIPLDGPAGAGPPEGTKDEVKPKISAAPLAAKMSPANNSKKVVNSVHKEI